MIIIGVEYIINFGLFSGIFLNKLINKCPATIFAISRIAKVIGRIKFLIVSIITINDESIIGVPLGII
jgi:hypothetical protein